MNSIFNNEQIDFLKENYNKMSYGDIAKILGFTERQVRGKINNLGLSKIRKFNTSYFKSIKTPNQAYWLGFIYADGYIVKNELGIELKDTDCKVLYDFKNELGNVHTVSFRENSKSFNGYDYDTKSCVIRIYSHKIVTDLAKLNVYPNKTNREEYPICENYFWDFLRGFLDGDGCIYINPKNYISVKFVNSNRKFLEYILQTISEEIHIDGTIYKETDKKYQLVYFTQNDVKVLLNVIYYNDNVQKLERKYNKYKSYYGSPA